MSPDEKIRVGISTCLLGINVRFDGGHKKDSFVTGVLADYVEWVPVCPEVEVGMGTPREPVRLVLQGSSVRMLGTRSETDWTRKINQYAKSKTNELRKLRLDGYILKSKSPSCGMSRVKQYSPKGMPSGSGPGLFAEALMNKLPNLPIEEEGRLNDPRLRENFIVRLFAHNRWRKLREKRLRIGDLVAFHAAHKFLLLAHNEAEMRRLGKLIARAKEWKPAELFDEYEAGLFTALKRPATPRRHANVMQHVAGFFSDELSAAEKKELDAAITDYRKGLLPLIVPITLLRHYLMASSQPYLDEQVYLHPHPKEMMLLNHV